MKTPAVTTLLLRRLLCLSTWEIDVVNKNTVSDSKFTLKRLRRHDSLIWDLREEFGAFVSRLGLFLNESSLFWLQSDDHNSSQFPKTHRSVPQKKGKLDCQFVLSRKAIDTFKVPAAIYSWKEERGISFPRTWLLFFSRLVIAMDISGWYIRIIRVHLNLFNVTFESSSKLRERCHGIAWL